jgi:4-hydroxybenzoate polyprenyltransferase
MLSTLIQALRVYQWPKNLLVFAALIFAGQLLIPAQVLRSLGAFFAFCAASSAMYLFNDLYDVEADRQHPEKRNRPLPSGRMSTGFAWALLLLCMAAAIGLAASINIRFLMLLMFYLLLTALYTLSLKYIMLVDVIVIAVGFVIRAIAGAVALKVAFSDWLVVCTLFLALFLGLSKRRHEIHILNNHAGLHRRVLNKYSVPFLDSLTLVVAGATLITYTIYTCSPEVVSRLGTDKMYITLPFVLYGMFRYLYLVHENNQGGDPSMLLLKDRSLGLAILLWGLACMGIIYCGNFVSF